MKYVNLYNNAKMPLVGLGTWRAQPQEIENTVNSALDCGYRHIDTAFNYNTEAPIGETLKKWFDNGKGRREDIFVTTKLPVFGNRSSDVEKFLNMSLEKLKLNYVDLYLIHMPFSIHCNESSYSPKVNEDGTFSVDFNSDLLNTWKEMEKQVNNGLTKSIGLSNCNAEQVERIYKAATIKPAVLQVELHVYLQQKKLVETCKRLNIAVTAYSPLGSPGVKDYFRNNYKHEIKNIPNALTDPIVCEVAKKLNKEPGQILLRFLVQQGIIVIPKSKNPDRIKMNADIFNFELSPEDMIKLTELDQGNSCRILDFLFFKGIEKHQEYPFKELLSNNRV